MIVKCIKLKLVCNLGSIELVFRDTVLLVACICYLTIPKNVNLISAEISPMLFSVF